MLDLEAKTNTLNLTASEKRLFSLSIGEAISKFYEDENNLKSFKQEEKNLKKEVKRLELKRDSGKKEQKS